MTSRKPKSDWVELQETPLIVGETVYEPDEGLTQSPAFVRFPKPPSKTPRKTKKERKAKRRQYARRKGKET